KVQSVLTNREGRNNYEKDSDKRACHDSTATEPVLLFFFSSRRRHTRWPRDWSSDVCSSDLGTTPRAPASGSARAPAASAGRPTGSSPAAARRGRATGSRGGAARAGRPPPRSSAAASDR